MLIKFENITKKYKKPIYGILHIGAHMCEENEFYKKYGVKNEKIIWVEANPELVKKNKEIDPNLNIKNFIASDKDKGKTKLNISNNYQSSSILNLGTHKKHYPHIKYDNFVYVKNNRIDTMYKEDNIPNNFANFINLDIQGAELIAIKGMGDLLNYFDYIYTEVNKEQVYENCPLIEEIDDYLEKFNFTRVETEWAPNNTGWGDALYIKKKNINNSEHFTNYVIKKKSNFNLILILEVLFVFLLVKKFIN